MHSWASSMISRRSFFSIWFPTLKRQLMLPRSWKSSHSSIKWSLRKRSSRPRKYRRKSTSWYKSSIIMLKRACSPKSLYLSRIESWQSTSRRPLRSRLNWKRRRRTYPIPSCWAPNIKSIWPWGHKDAISSIKLIDRRSRNNQSCLLLKRANRKLTLMHRNMMKIPN